jgi:hypothetical protein
MAFIWKVLGVPGLTRIGEDVVNFEIANPNWNIPIAHPVVMALELTDRSAVAVLGDLS